ncbi:MAG: 2-deoxy-5-keto-D-gluconate 6-phosphate aldolase domain-containing protein [Candidatus Bathyarchaeia archaeon]
MDRLIDWTKKELLILAFDHRSSFTEKLFGIKNRKPTPEEKKTIEDYKKTIFAGFRLALKNGVPKDIAGLLVDEEFGADVLREAKKAGFTFAMPVEKSGQDEFDFEFGDKYAEHITMFDPTYVKVLVRYNPEGDSAVNQRQLRRLKELSDYLQRTKKPFLFELIVPATAKQLADCGGAKEAYDQKCRPKLMVRSLAEIQKAGIEPSIWKLEGVEDPADAKAVVAQAQSGGRKAGVITLGRGESKEMVQKWLAVGAKIPGIIGFAVGRTIFWEPLSELKAGKSAKDEAAAKIEQNYLDFTKLWLNEKKR